MFNPKLFVFLLLIAFTTQRVNAVSPPTPFGAGKCNPNSHPSQTNSTTCECDFGYTGDNCEHDSCFQQTCGNHGSCKPALKCDCFACDGCNDDLYMCGSIKSNPEICDGDDDLGCYTNNPFECVCTTGRPTNPTPYICNCDGGFTGADCQTVDHCYPIQCPKHSTCKTGRKKSSCPCNPGFTGKDCTSVDYCYQANCPIPVKSVCINGPFDYSCKCNDGWRGSYCNTCRGESQDHSPDCDGITLEDCLKFPQTIPAKCPFVCNSCVLDRCKMKDPRKCGRKSPYLDSNCHDTNLVGQEVRKECPALCGLCKNRDLPAYAKGIIGGGSLLVLGGILGLNLVMRKRAAALPLTNTESVPGSVNSEASTQLLNEQQEPNESIYE